MDLNKEHKIIPFVHLLTKAVQHCFCSFLLKSHLSSCQVQPSVKTSLFIAKAFKLGDLGLANNSEEHELLWFPVCSATVVTGYVLSKLEE